LNASFPTFTKILLFLKKISNPSFQSLSNLYSHIQIFSIHIHTYLYIYNIYTHVHSDIVFSHLIILFSSFSIHQNLKMNDLFSGSFSRNGDQGLPDHHHHVVEMAAVEGGVNLDKFFEEVEQVKEELKELERLHENLRVSHEKSKTLHSANAVKELRSRMDADVTLALKKAKLIKVRLEALDRSNQASLNLPGSGPGSSSDRTRTSVVNGLRKKLKDSMDNFNSLRQQISSEYRETVQRRYYTVTGENPDDKTIDLLISTGVYQFSNFCFINFVCV